MKSPMFESDSKDFIPRYSWISKGSEMYPCMIESIDASNRSIRLETYIFKTGEVANRIKEAILRAVNRGVEVKVLLDAFGSKDLPEEFWRSAIQSGLQLRWFNPLSLRSIGIRNHRKLLCVDSYVALLGGFNIADHYDGDGVTKGWRDLGMRITGGVVETLESSFDMLFEHAEERIRPFPRLRKSVERRSSKHPNAELLLSGPGRGASGFEQALVKDIKSSQSIDIVSAYFLPTIRLRSALKKASIRGARVRIILPGLSDVSISRLASRSFYQTLLLAGIELHEYQPQILHAKLVITDQGVYVGSANLDRRSFRINYELLLRIEAPNVIAEARNHFKTFLDHCAQIDRARWKNSRPFWERFKERWSHFILAVIDPMIAKRQLRTLR